MSVYSKLLDGLTNGENYYAKVFTVNPEGRVNNRVDLPWTSAIPLEAPANVADFTVSGSYYAAAISWANPTDGIWAETVIVQKNGSEPTSIEDGTEVYRGTGTSVSVSGLPINTTVYFAAFTLNANLEYSGCVTASYITPNQVVLMGSGYDSSLTGGWAKKTYTGTSKNTASLTISNTSASWSLYGYSDDEDIENGDLYYSRILGYTNNKIDLTNFSKITFTGSRGTRGIMSSVPSFNSEYNSRLNTTVNFTKKTTGSTLDISGVTGSYYIAFFDQQLEQSTVSGSMSKIIIE